MYYVCKINFFYKFYKFKSVVLLSKNYRPMVSFKGKSKTKEK